MKCINKLLHLKGQKKYRLLCLLSITAVLFTGCGNSMEGVSNSYSAYDTDFTTGSASAGFFAENLCVTENINFGQDLVASESAEAAGLFNLDTQNVNFSQNLFRKMYPASTTKIMTALIILRYGNLDDSVTVSYEAAHPADSASSVCGLKEGDIITVRDLLYGLLLQSGNDAATALAEYYSGSEEAFAEVMNEEAKRLGATGTHFSNPHGLPDESHYTTVYDMYLIMSEACSISEFSEIASTKTITVSYQDQDGSSVTQTWNSTCHYLTGENQLPDGYELIAAKTGTTSAAGYCLVCAVTNPDGERVIAIVYKADTRWDLYQLMTQLLKTYGD